MTPPRLALAAASVAVAVVATACGSNADRRFDADVQRQQQVMLDDLGRALPLLRRAGHDASAAEVVAYIEGPVSGYRVPRPYTTTVSDGADVGRSTELTLHIVSYQRYEITAGADRTAWGRACATVTIDMAQDAIRTETQPCSAALPASGPLPSTLSDADLEATQTPVALAVAEAMRGSNISELQHVIGDKDGAGVAYGG